MATMGHGAGAAETETPGGSPRANPLNRNALNVPNLITVSRLVLALVLFALIYAERFWITAAVLFVVAASTDVVDGYIARKYGLITALGRILDPFVDKIIVCGAFVFLLEKRYELSPGVEVWSGVNAWMVIIVIGREMFVSSLRGFLEEQGLDFSANWAGKIKMFMQSAAVTLCLLSLSPSFASPSFHLMRDLVLWTAVLVTAYSGLAYVLRAIALLREQKA
jgi:CDP-diacylglycerol--glycerol-3-phosphate 3-phosphatidyltransferase